MFTPILTNKHKKIMVLDTQAKLDNQELLKEVQNRIIANSLSESEIDVLTSTTIKKTGRCFLCGKVKEVSELMEIKLNEDEVKRFLIVKWQEESREMVKDSMLRQRLIYAYKKTVANKELQKELEVWDKIEEEDINENK